MGNPTFCADSRLDKDVVIFPAAASGFPGSNLNDDRTFTIYKPSGNPDPLDIETNAGAGNFVAVDYFGLVEHDLFTQQATIAFQSSNDNFATVNTIFTLTPSTNKIILMTFPPQFFQHFRVRVTGQIAAPSFGELQWGKRMETPFGVSFRGFDPQDERLQVRFNRSQTGNHLGSIVAFSERRAKMRIPLLPNSFLRDQTLGGFQDFWDNHGSKLKPFFFTWNSNNVFREDAFFAVVDPRSDIRRRLVTPLDAGIRDLDIDVIGIKC